MYRVFLGAPPVSALDSNETYHWQTVSSTGHHHHHAPTRASSLRFLEPAPSAPERSVSMFIYPPATLEAASKRISMIYKNAIFDRTGRDEEDSYEEAESLGEEDVVSRIIRDQTTMISWPPTNPENASTSRLGPVHGGKSSLLLFDESALIETGPIPTGTYDSGAIQTQETQSFDYSDASSIGRFPTFHFNIHSVTALNEVSRFGGKGGHVKGRKVNVLLAILEVEGPEAITIKKGPDAGKQVGLLKLILGDEVGNVCKLTAWREVAEEWGGIGKGLGCKRGDVVLLESVLLDREPAMSPTLTASPNLKSKMTICFRTMPHAHEDGVFRPDLRLGESDPCVRKVASVVRWFEGMAGLPGSG